MDVIRRISPMIAIEDMQKTLDFYSTMLGFSAVVSSDNYSVIERDGARIHFMLASDQAAMDATRGHTEVYLEVENINAIWDKVSQLKSPYRVQPLVDRDYGMREFHLEDPNGVILFVGEPITQD